jgi:GT2 family glycosyltransferase
MRSTIIIAQHGQPRLTISCIESIRRHHGDEPEIVLVDDGSPAGDVEQVAAAGLSNVGLVRQPHRGVTGAWSAGAERATGDILIFLNNDVVSTGPWATRIASLLENDRVFVAGVQRRQERHLDADLLERLPTRVFAAGWCFAVRRRDFEAVGGFRKTLRLYFSDTDLQSRLLLRSGRGLEGIATARLPLWHLGHATTALCATRKEQWLADRRRFRRLWCGFAQGADAPRSPRES